MRGVVAGVRIRKRSAPVYPDAKLSHGHRPFSGRVEAGRNDIASQRQIGNAVPVKLAYIIGDSIAQKFDRMNDINAKRDSTIRAV